jgi:hypothetical protein
MSQGKTDTDNTDDPNGYTSASAKWRRDQEHDRAIRQGILYPPGRQLMPLERLLLEMNDPLTPLSEQRRALELALPYCHAPKAAEAPAAFDLSKLKTAAQMLNAQRRIMKSVGEGKTPVALGKMMIDSITSMLKALAYVEFEARVEAHEARAKLNGGAGPRLVVYPGGVDDDDEEPAA